MRKIGLVGGISWTSTMDYYRFINEGVNRKLGGLNFAECTIHSLNFADLQQKTWPNSYDLLLSACTALKRSGVDAIALCANTAHLFADELQENVQLPLIHIGAETGKAVKRSGFKKAALLGTKFTMEMNFYKQKLKEYGVEAVIPQKQTTRDYIQDTVKNELGVGYINPGTKSNYIEIVNELVEDGAECLILGCTEIPLLISQEDFQIPVFDTTKIHTEAIVDFVVGAPVTAV